MAAPTPWELLQKGFNWLQNSQFAIPLPSATPFQAPAGSIPSYLPQNNAGTGPMGTAQGGFGGAPSTAFTRGGFPGQTGARPPSMPTALGGQVVAPFTAPPGTTGGLSPDERGSTPPPTTYGTPVPGTPTTILGGTEGGMGATLNPRENNPRTTNALGNPADTVVTEEDRLSMGLDVTQMQEAGYVYNNVERQWVMEGTPTTSSGTWYGKNYRVGGGYKAPIFLSSFRTEQAYQTWLRQQKMEAKEEQDKKGGSGTTKVGASYNVGTG